MLLFSNIRMAILVLLSSLVGMQWKCAEWIMNWWSKPWRKSITNITSKESSQLTEDAGTARLSRILGSGISIQDIDTIQFCLQRIKGHSLGGGGHHLPEMLQLDKLASVFLMGSCSKKQKEKKSPEFKLRLDTVFSSYDTVFIEFRCKRVN